MQAYRMNLLFSLVPLLFLASKLQLCVLAIQNTRVKSEVLDVHIRIVYVGLQDTGKQFYFLLRGFILNLLFFFHDKLYFSLLFPTFTSWSFIYLNAFFVKLSSPCFYFCFSFFPLFLFTFLSIKYNNSTAFIKSGRGKEFFVKGQI